jgi:glutathionylspermidine synthase
MISVFNQQPVRSELDPEALLSVPRLRAGASLDQRTFQDIRRRAVLEGCKWDPQVGDVSTLATFPLILSQSAWAELAMLTERLTTETLQAEREMLDRPELLNTLGLPRAVCDALKRPEPPAPAAARVMRFDFHPTSDGWRISEVNSDVPGGFTEASFFTGLVAGHFPDAHTAGNPMDLWADAIATAANGGNVGLLTAPGFMEDHQIVAYLADHLRARGCETHLANPRQLCWKDHVAHLDTHWHRGKLDAVVRFFQSEWLPHLPRHCDWKQFFRGGQTPIGNPGMAVMVESKRFPLVWDKLEMQLPNWRALLPETCDPRDCAWRDDDSWLLKATMSNTGDEVCIREFMKPREWQRLRWDVWLRPNRWLGQRRFESLPVETPLGSMHVCLGVYSIDGKVAGIYGRLAPRPLIEYSAVDVAVLIDHNE